MRLRCSLFAYVSVKRRCNRLGPKDYCLIPTHKNWWWCQKKGKWYQKNVSTKYPGKLKLQPLNTSVPSPHKPSIRIMYRVQGEYATGNIPQSPKTWTRLFGEEHVRQTDPQSGKQILKPEFREILNNFEKLMNFQFFHPEIMRNFR